MAEHQQAQKSSESKSNIQTRAIPPKQMPTSHPAAIIQRARINPKSLTHADVMQLQRTIGNQAVGRLLSEIGLIPSKAKQAQPVQMQSIPEEEKEPLQGKFAEPLQRQEISEEEAPLQEKMNGTIQRQEPKKEEKPQMKSVMQRQEIPEEEEPIQGKFESGHEKEICPSCIQMQEIHEEEEEPLQAKKENNTGMPDNLKAGVENLSGIDISDVRVHYNSDKPAEVGALAYTQGTDIHVAPGQERHLPHEAWHVIQQAQDRVKPTMKLKDGFSVNDDQELEHDANMMGEKASRIINGINSTVQKKCKRCLNEDEKNHSIQLKNVVQLHTECSESDHPTEPIHRWIQAQYKARISGGGKSEYHVLEGTTERFVDIADTSVNEIYEIKPKRKRAQGRAEAIFYRNLLNARCGGGWILGKKEKGFRSTEARGNYIIVRFPEPGVITYELKEVELSDAESLSSSDNDSDY